MKDDNDLFLAISNVTGDGLCLCEMIVDADGKAVDYRFLETNPQFEEFTGLIGAKGRTALEMVPGLEYHWVEAYARVGLGRETLRFENGSVPMGRWFEVYASPVEPHGRLMILFRDVSSRRLVELERERELEQSRSLMQELNHRVKNSLSVISSIIALEGRSKPDDMKDALARVQSRVRAVGDLYATMATDNDAEAVQISTYLEKIVDGVKGSLSAGDHITFDTRFSNELVPGRAAVSLGLIINELLTNCVKYAFRPGEPGRISVSLDRIGDECVAEVRDNGRGLAAGTHDGGLGTKLVSVFVSDLGGRMERVSTSDGTIVTMTFPVPALRQA